MKISIAIINCYYSHTRCRCTCEIFFVLTFAKNSANIFVFKRQFKSVNDKNPNKRITITKPLLLLLFFFLTDLRYSVCVYFSKNVGGRGGFFSLYFATDHYQPWFN